MKKIRDATEDEMILVFLQEELNSERFCNDILSALKQLNLKEEIIRSGNLNDDNENSLRKSVLGVFRGYPDKEIFENYPKMMRWELVQFDASDLDRIFYIDYDYWNELSKGTSKPSVAAQSVFEGIEIFDVSNKQMFEARDFLRTGKFPPVIAYTCGNGKYLLLEGHKRMTVYGMLPEKFTDSYGYIGYCSKEAMRKKDKRMTD